MEKLPEVKGKKPLRSAAAALPKQTAAMATTRLDSMRICLSPESLIPILHFLNATENSTKSPTTAPEPTDSVTYTNSLGANTLARALLRPEKYARLKGGGMTIQPMGKPVLLVYE
jgi:hypothetical protein